MDEISPVLPDLAESLLWFLEGNPSEMSKVFEHFPIDIVKAANGAQLIWFQPSDLTFFITHRGIDELRSRGRKRKPLPHLTWKENPHEMSADRAIELFAPSQKLTPAQAEGLLVNERPRKPPRFKQLAPFSVKKQKHLPRKPKKQ